MSNETTKNNSLIDPSAYGYTPNTDFDGDIGKFAVIGADREVDLPSGAGVATIGVVLDVAKTGADAKGAVNLGFGGGSEAFWLETGSTACNEGDFLTTDANGAAVPVSAAGDNVNARAVIAAGTSSQTAAILNPFPMPAGLVGAAMGTLTVSNGGTTGTASVGADYDGNFAIVSPVEDLGAITHWWSTVVASGTLTVTVDQDPTQDVDFAYIVFAV